MRRRNLFFLAAALVVIAVALVTKAATAYGATPLEVSMVEQVAEQTFPNAQCAGRVWLVRPNQADLDKLVGFTNTGNPLVDKHAGGAAIVGNADGTCRLFVLDDIYNDGGYEFCVVYVHEYGHLAGYEHSHDPASVMYADGPMQDFAPCDALKPKVSVLSARIALRQRLRARGLHWRIKDCYHAGEPDEVDCDTGTYWRGRTYAITARRIGSPLSLKIVSNWQSARYDTRA